MHQDYSPHSRGRKDLCFDRQFRYLQRADAAAVGERYQHSGLGRSSPCPDPENVGFRGIPWHQTYHNDLAAKYARSRGCNADASGGENEVPRRAGGRVGRPRKTFVMYASQSEYLVYGDQFNYLEWCVSLLIRVMTGGYVGGLFISTGEIGSVP